MERGNTVRPIGVSPADMQKLKDKLKSGHSPVFIGTREGAKEVILTASSDIIVKNTGALIVDSEKYMKDRQITTTSNWYKLISSCGPPILHLGPIAFFAQKGSGQSIMINTLTDAIIPCTTA
jgi:hypothetical protein